MQIRSDGLPLLHEMVPLNPELAFTRACGHTHTPNTALTYLHYHDSLEIGYCYEGSGIFIVDSRVLPFSAGCASVIFPQEVHIAQSSAEQGSKWKFINLDPAMLLGRSLSDAAWLLEPGAAGFSGVIAAEDPSGLAAVIRELIDESAHTDPAGQQAMKGLALCLLARLSRMARLEPLPRRHAAQGAVRSISAALDAIVKNHAQPLPIPELAAACGMSITTFRRAFARAMGRAPGDYIHNLRIQLASLQLIYTASPVLDIALAVGYDSLSSFNRQFKRITGVSPREYRKGQASPSNQEQK